MKSNNLECTDYKDITITPDVRFVQWSKITDSLFIAKFTFLIQFSNFQQVKMKIKETQFLKFIILITVSEGKQLCLSAVYSADERISNYAVETKHCLDFCSIR